MSARADFMLDFGCMSLKIYGDLPRTISGETEFVCGAKAEEADEPVVNPFLFVGNRCCCKLL